MEINVKGHSGCKIEIVRDGDKLYVFKSSNDIGYLNRLERQALKQSEAAKQELQHIRIPKIHQIVKDTKSVVIKMDYVYSRNFIEFFEQAGFEQIDYLIGALILLINKEIEKSSQITIPSAIVYNKFKDVFEKTTNNPNLKDDKGIEKILNRSSQIFKNWTDMTLPVGTCHGDLTFSNILFNGNNYYLIDFLDSFIESPLLDIVKLRQDTAWHWSELMYIYPFDNVRLRIAMDKIDTELDSYFRQKYDWYREYYGPMQLMNFLRILQYAHEPKVITYLKKTINEQLQNI